MRSGARAIRALGLSLTLLSASAPAFAHARSTSWSSIWIEGREARLVVRVSQLELSRLPYGIVSPGRIPAGLGAYVTGRVGLLAGGVPCPVVSPPRVLPGPAERAAIRWRVACPAEGDLAVESRFLHDVAPTHLHFVRLRTDGERLVERVLSETEPRWELSRPGAAAPEGSTLLAYLSLGTSHIASGVDHLVFLFGLLLLARRLGEVVTIVTGFTLAHSITLALAALGHVQPQAAAVEALIGLSIALVAVENGWLLAGRPRAVPWAVAGLLIAMALAAALGLGAVPAATLLGLALFTTCYLAMVDRSARPARLRFAIAFAFGLVHGFGFAGVLTEIGLPNERLVPALLGFNLGVEAGQLVVVALAWPLLLLLPRLGERLHRRVLEGSTAAICALGVFWLVSRSYGP